MSSDKIAALPPCSPATGQRRRVLGGYVSPLLRMATWILKKTRTTLRGPQKPHRHNWQPAKYGYYRCSFCHIWKEPVRQALSVCVQGAIPPLTDEEFEVLNCRILDHMFLFGEKGAGDVITKFLEAGKK